MTRPDVFAEADANFTIPEVWRLLNLPGEPQVGRKIRSPFRVDEHPSCDISGDGKWFRDRTHGLNFRVVRFTAQAFGGGKEGFREARRWLAERLGIDLGTGAGSPPKKAVVRPTIAPETSPEPKAIQWPGKLRTGTGDELDAFSERFGITRLEADHLVMAGALRFVEAWGHPCYAVTDAERRNGEIRRLDGGKFRDAKVFPLRGPDKAHPLGIHQIQPDRPGGVLVTEGASDYLAGHVLRCRHVSAGGRNPWFVVAFLGAGLNRLDAKSMAAIRGRRVMLAFDGDSAGDRARSHWTGKFEKAGCRIGHFRPPRGTDLRDWLPSLDPFELFGPERRKMPEPSFAPPLEGEELARALDNAAWPEPWKPGDPYPEAFE